MAIVVWGYSFLRNFERTLRFSVVRQDDFLLIHSGVFTRRENLVRISHVNALLLQQNLICAPFGIVSAALSCTGYGPKTGTSNVLLPTGRAGKIVTELKHMLPELAPAPRKSAPEKTASAFSSCRRYSSAAGFCCFSAHCFPVPGATLDRRVGLVITEIPSLWWLLARLIGFYRAGVAKTENGYVFCYLRGFRLMTACVPNERISHFLCYHSWMQASSHSCHLVVSLYGNSA